MNASPVLQPTEPGFNSPLIAFSDSPRQPWIHSPALDLAFILGPALIVSTVALAFHGGLEQYESLPLWAWVALVVGVDVAHVYGTLFRTYLNPVEFNRNKTLLTIIPLACWVGGALLYSMDGMLFWRALAYVAVFHFVRQQYGFWAIYSRREPAAYQSYRWLDSWVIHLAMIFPLVYWHTHLPRAFCWFIDGDFLPIGMRALSWVTGGAFALAMLGYLLKEITLGLKHQFINIPKNLLIFGTALSWGIGIIAFNNDLIFTATNVISHGIPYMALIWVYGQREAEQTPPPRENFLQRRLFSKLAIPLFIAILWALALLEEGLWDGLIWRDHTQFFSLFSHLPQVTDKSTLAWLAPMLALPQSTHYVLDGFIWRMKSASENQWVSTLLKGG